MTTHLPQHVVDTVRDWCWNEFNFGEWQDNKAIADFIRKELGYTGDTPNQYARRFITRGVEHRDFETRLRQWRWIVHTPTSA